MPASNKPAPPAPATAGGSDVWWQIAGTVTGIALAAVTALWEAVLTPWYVVVSGHVIRLPVAPLLAIVANIGIVWFTLRVTKRVGLSLLPGLAWIIVMFAAGDLTSDGDLIVEGTWVGLATILVGALAWAAGGYIWIARTPKRSLPAPAPVAATRPRAPATPGRPRPAGRTRPKKSKSR